MEADTLVHSGLQLTVALADILGTAPRRELLYLFYLFVNLALQQFLKACWDAHWNHKKLIWETTNGFIITPPIREHSAPLQ